MEYKEEYGQMTDKFKDQQEEKENKKVKKNIAFAHLTNAQKGFISIGVAAGAIYAIHTKRSFLGILGFMFLGNIAGGGIGTLFGKCDCKK